MARCVDVNEELSVVVRYQLHNMTLRKIWFCPKIAVDKITGTMN